MYTNTRESSTSKTPARVATRIVAALEKDIVQGALRPGERLDEQALAQRFEVSRTPVREALQELAALGLATQQAHRGSFVADVTLEEVFGSYEVLAELEGLCARLAARRMTAEQKTELEQLHTRMAGCLDAAGRSQYIELDAAFHLTLVAGAHNPSLAEHIGLCLQKIAPVRLGSMHSVADMATAHAEHGALVQAVLAADAAQAEQLMTAHVSLRAEQVRDLVALWHARRQSAPESASTRRR
jgi:DNA-binding GntR family transcriptional regulator